MSCVLDEALGKLKNLDETNDTLTESGIYKAIYDYFELSLDGDFIYGNVDEDKVREYNKEHYKGMGKIYFVTLQEGDDGDVSFYREEIE